MQKILKCAAIIAAVALLLYIALAALMAYNRGDDGDGVIVTNGFPRVPLEADAYVIAYKFDTVRFNTRTNNPDWVKWKVTVDRVGRKIADRKVCSFTADTLNVRDRSNEVSSDDYSGSGYDRGHMAPAADMTFSKVAMRECHYMTNICPQSGDLNRGVWKTLEDRTRLWCKRYGTVYIAAGPLYTGKDTAWIGKRHKVAVPDKFFKVVMTRGKGNPKAIGFVFDNRKPDNNLKNAVVTVDEIERLTGFDFFDWLPDDVEDRVEATAKLGAWSE